MTAFPTPTGSWEPLSVSATLDEHMRKVPPPRLYHYCDMKALIGIAENKVLWATDLAFLNDEAEREHGIELIRKKITEFEHEDPGLFRELSRQTNMRGDPHNRLFLASFTEKVTLPMFRMYCPDEGGYCLRLPTSQIKGLAGLQRFRLVKCIYDDDLKDKIITEMLRSTLERSRELQAEPGLSTRKMAAIKSNVMTFGGFVAGWAPAMKHSSFKDENEWRIISQAFGGGVDPNVGFRESRFHITPYYKFKLAPPEYPDLIRSSETENSLHVFLGPANTNQERRKVAAQWLFQQNVGPVGISVFSTTYR
jgi:Protein of unknown function (DUF2971)